MISSVFESESPSSSYTYSTDGDDEGSGINSHEVEDMDVSSKQPDEAKQIERKLVLVKDCNGTSLAIISEIDSKHAIEQLLMQESFSRDEGNKLNQIIESRVVEVGNDGKQKELDRITCNAFTSPRTGKYLNFSRKLPEAIHILPVVMLFLQGLLLSKCLHLSCATQLLRRQRNGWSRKGWLQAHKLILVVGLALRILVRFNMIGQAQDEATQQDGSDRMQCEASDLRISANGFRPLTGLNTDMNLALRDEPNTTSRNNDGPAADVSSRVCELANVKTSNVPPPRRTSSTRSRRPRGGTKMKSVKDVVTPTKRKPRPGEEISAGIKERERERKVIYAANLIGHCSTLCKVGTQ